MSLMAINPVYTGDPYMTHSVYGTLMTKLVTSLSFAEVCRRTLDTANARYKDRDRPRRQLGDSFGPASCDCSSPTSEPRAIKSRYAPRNTRNKWCLSSDSFPPQRVHDSSQPYFSLPLGSIKYKPTRQFVVIVYIMELRSNLVRFIGISVDIDSNLPKSSQSVQCAITGPCLRMRHRPWA